MQGECGLAEALARLRLVSAAQGEIALRRPGRGGVTRRRESGKALLCLREAGFGLVGAAELEQGAAEHDLGRAELVEIVDAIAQELDRVARVPLGLLEAPRVELDARERRDRLRGVSVVAQVERRRERLLEELLRALGVAEQVLVGADVGRRLVRRCGWMSLSDSWGVGADALSVEPALLRQSYRSVNICERRGGADGSGPARLLAARAPGQPGRSDGGAQV